ncbi:MAG: nucleotidyl transferase [Fibrobacter sp.]|nr:nucleotidyl transferase [Fibrobacter sp.]
MDNYGNKLNVLILAAGLGTRLRPLTNTIPKPLVPVVDASVLEQQAKKAKVFDDVRLHVNAHYLAEQMVAEGERLGFEKVWVEPEILGTAGPLKRIYNEGYRGGLLVMNGDAYCNFDLMEFVKKARFACQDKTIGRNTPGVALLAVDYPKVNTFRVGADSRLSGVVGRFGPDQGLPATFSGISWYSDEALSRIRDGEFDIREFWKQEMAADRSPYVDMSQMKATWIDMGSPEGFAAACFARLEELCVDSWIHPSIGENFPMLFASMPLCPEVKVRHSVIERGVVIGAGATIENSILMEGALVKAGELVANEIRGRDFVWKI